MNPLSFQQLRPFLPVSVVFLVSFGVLWFLSALSKPQTVVTRGHYTHGFEQSFFQPCHTTTIWDVRGGNLQAIDQFEARITDTYGQGGTMYVEWRGYLSSRIEAFFGFRAAQFDVQEVLAIRTSQATDCQ